MWHDADGGGNVDIQISRQARADFKLTDNVVACGDAADLIVASDIAADITAGSRAVTNIQCNQARTPRVPWHPGAEWSTGNQPPV